MLAFLLAIGLSFAFVESTAHNGFATKYILVQEPDGWASINVQCVPDNAECKVRFSNNPREYLVYDQMDLTKPAEGNGETIQLNGSAPNPD